MKKYHHFFLKDSRWYLQIACFLSKNPKDIQLMITLDKEKQQRSLNYDVFGICEKWFKQ